MCNISTRLDNLNQQLMIISKLQNMEEECNICSIPSCKKCSIHNFGKLYHCAHHILSFKEQCNKFNDKCISYNDSKRKIPCNSRSCKTRRKLLLCRDIKLAEVQTDLKDDIQVSKGSTVNTKNNTISQDHVQVPEKSHKSNQISLNSQSFKTSVTDKVVDTYEEKNEQTIPTKDNSHTEASTNNSNGSIMQLEAPSKETAQTEVDRNFIEENNGLKEFYYNPEDIYRDINSFERIQKELLDERRRTVQLEKKLKSLTCNLKCLKEEQRAACLRNAVETTDQEIEVAVKESKAETDLVRNTEEQLLNEISRLQQQIIEVAHANTALSQERDHLKNKLQSYSEEETRRCEEVEREVNRMKQAAKEKEDAVNTERTEFMDMIMELTNVIKIQKRRICEVTGICNNQQHTLQERDKELLEKNSALLEVKQMLESSNCVCKELEEKIEDLKYGLCEERKACDCLKQELETLTENHSSELRIKEKIVEEQNKTISKQKKLLHDSEEMAQQVACEFDQLKDELHKEKQRNKSLQLTLDKTDTELNNAYLSQCEQCRKFIDEIDYLKKEKQRALTVAKLAYQKLHQSIKQYQTKLVYERQQYRYMVSIVNKKEQEIGCLKNQICQYNGRSLKNVNGYIT
ncbi:uncharacterized protein LOC117601961 [Osmia lignaria lignaria]|uniref:uncharacterized protein LOC117601961 n=1 Tax=Osmia lignaria lignaria TaxID=1437193 RepID=UPI00402B99AB